jgi:hypothetical protein
MPTIESIWKDYRARDVQFYGTAINTGNGKGILDAFKLWGVDWPWGIDLGYHAINRFGITAFPVIVVVGRDGVIQAVMDADRQCSVDNGHGR